MLYESGMDLKSGEKKPQQRARIAADCSSFDHFGETNPFSVIVGLKKKHITLATREQALTFPEQITVHFLGPFSQQQAAGRDVLRFSIEHARLFRDCLVLRGLMHGLPVPCGNERTQDDGTRWIFPDLFLTD
jgi:hypothetical protein